MNHRGNPTREWVVLGLCPHGRQVLITFDEMGYIKRPSVPCPVGHVLPKTDAQAKTPGFFSQWSMRRRFRRQLKEGRPPWPSK